MDEGLLKQEQDLVGMRALVVGGTSGIGQAIAVLLGRRGAHVTVAGRSKERGLETVAQMGGGGGQQENDFESVDASLISDVARFSKEFSTKVKRVWFCVLLSTSRPLDCSPKNDKLDVLVLTQGIATTQGYTPTSEGIDVKMSLHYFSRVAFVEALAPLLQKSELGGKVMFVLSAGVHSPYLGESFDLRDNYSLSNAANAAGFYSDLACDALAKKYPTLRVMHAAPGFVATNWGTEMPWLLRGLVRVAQTFAKKADTCAERLSVPLLGKEPGFFLVDENGGYLKPLPEHTPERVADIWTKTTSLLSKAT